MTSTRTFRTAALLLLTLLVSAHAAVAQTLKNEKFQLPNGLTVILHEDHTLPVATINLWYRVGAKNEPPGRSGFAHLFEHLMFMGTARVPGNDFDVLMETGGGSNNASTGFDRTNYFSSGPSSLLPTLLWLDADRLEDLGRTMSQEKLDKQRDVVRNELRQTVENAPYGKAGEIVYQHMYPVGHPYHFGVIGTHEDLEAATVANVKDFFATFYVPNNATLVVAGNFDSARMKPLITELFGSIPRGSQPPQPAYIPQKLTTVKHVTALDKVQQPKVGFYYHAPATYADGDAELQLLAAILADGPSSRLYQRLVLKDQLAASVSASQDGATLGSIFKIEVLAKPDADLARIEAIIDEEIAKVLAGGASGITDDELTPRKNTFETGLISSLQSIASRADKLNEYEYFFGDPDSLQRDLDRYRKASPAAVTDWSKKTLTPDARLMMRVLPEDTQGRAPTARDKRPADGTDAAFTPPMPERFKLAAGPDVLLYRRPALPLVSMELLVTGPSALDSIEQSGRSTLMAAMLSEGTKTLDNVQFAQALQRLGASFGAGADTRSFTASVSSLKKNFEGSVALFADAIRNPRMAETDWQRVQALHIEDLKQEDEEPRAVAARVSSRLLFGPTNPFAWPSEGTVETSSKLTLADIRAAHSAVLRPDRATIVIAGDITADEARAILDKALSGWKPAGSVSTTPDDVTIPARTGLGFYIVPREGATQTVIQYRAPGVPWSDPSRVARRVLNVILGGSFTSRLNQNLREEHGYTYGARSGFGFDRDIGSFSAAASVKADVTGPSLTEFMKEFARIRADKGDITPAEVTKAKETIRTETIQAFGSLGGTISIATHLLEVGAPLDATAADLRALDAITADQLNALSRAALPLDAGVLVLIGDKDLILKQIAGLQLPKPQFVDAQGNPLK